MADAIPLGSSYDHSYNYHLFVSENTKNMDESPQKRSKKQRFQPFVIRKGIVLRRKQQKTALELSKSKNDSSEYEHLKPK